MDSDKDIRYTNKKVDESWKEQASREKETLAEHSIPPAQQGAANPSSKPGISSQAKIPTSREFINLLSSLSYQAMMHLGEIPDPSTGQKETNLETAREIIELLTALQKKTEGRVSQEEVEVFSSILPELQMKFSRLV